MANVTTSADSAKSDGAAAMSPLKRAFLALENARSRIAQLEGAASEPIAIIGMGCRIPGGVQTPEEFWDLLAEGRDATGNIPSDRWDVEATYHPDPDTPGRIATRRGGFLGAIDGFDASFFGITRREAQGMDPQQRMLLEVCWEALERAGFDPAHLERSSTGVYVGLAGSDYTYLQLKTGDASLLDAHFASGMAHSVASGRISYLLGLQGPSVTLDTACSSSLVAVHLACQALRAGDCKVALAGGVNLILSPEIFIALSRAHMLAPDGRCKTFDAAADGFARGEGCGVVVLKRLSDARAAGDAILAVIRGSAVNQDGASSGLTAPSGPAQEAVIREALARARLEPRSVGYIEAHGTGTQLGDPLEVSALAAVFGPDRDPAHPLRIGSVKTNVGHLESAAGVAGIIKLVLALQHRQIPAHLHFHTPSPHIPWGECPMEVPTAAIAWEQIDGRRIAGVSSFGFSGTNAHVILEEAPEEQGLLQPAEAGATRAALEPHAQLFILSARNSAALVALAARYAKAFETLTDSDLPDVCRSAATTRGANPERAAITARTMTQLRERLEAVARGSDADGVMRGRVTQRDPPRVGFLFTGQGAQYAGMARELHEREPVFRAVFARCAAIIDPLIGRPLADLIFAPDAGEKLLDQTRYTQPALFAVEYALAELWQSWGVKPDVVCGHSVGEFVAACVSGVLSLDDALRLVTERGRLMQSLPPGGAMAAVFAEESAVAEAIQRIAPRCAIAAANGPAQTVVSGDAAAVGAIVDHFSAQGARVQRLEVSHAFHSALIDPILDDLESAAGHAAFGAQRVRIVSNLTGRIAERGEMQRARYWRDQARATVRFADVARSVFSAAPDVFVEVGPAPTLLAFAQATLSTVSGGPVPAFVPSLRKSRRDPEQLQESLAALFLAGVPIDWHAVWAHRSARRVALPTYPFQRERLWFRARASRGWGGVASAAHPLLGTRVRSALRNVVQFESSIDIESLPYLADHRVQGRCILPATGFLEMALAASRAVFGEVGVLRDIVIREPLVVGDDEARIVQIVVRLEGQSGDFEILSCAPHSNAGAEDAWQHHVSGRMLLEPDSAAAAQPVDALAAHLDEHVSGAEHYRRLAGRGLNFGPSLQGVATISRRSGEALGEITAPAASVRGGGDYVLHPAVLDACLQTMNEAMPQIGNGESIRGDRPYLPFAIDRVRVWRSLGEHCRSHVRMEAGSSRQDLLRAHIQVLDEAGVVAELSGITLRAAAAATSSASDAFYRCVWNLREPALPPRALAPGGHWLIVSDEQGVGHALERALHAAAQTTGVIRAAQYPDDAMFRARVAELAEHATGVVHLRALDQLPSQSQHIALGSLIATVQALGAARQGRVPQLWIATSGAQVIDKAERLDPAMLRIGQAPIWGAAKSIALEHPELRAIRIDLDPLAMPEQQAAALVALLGEGLEEDEIAVRGAASYVSRLDRYRPGSTGSDDAGTAQMLQRASSGVLADLALVPASRSVPGPGEIEIRVLATGLNFRDVMNAVAMRDDPEPLGGECAGRVTRLGPGVTGFEVGDHVVATAVGCFATYAIADAAHAAHIPAGLSFAQAATLPFAYMTAHHAFELAGLRVGQTVLVHAGAGGVGLAAIVLAQRAGARVFATAGSERKRTFLQRLGVESVMDSRSLHFEREILARTAGRGVDVVLNSLAGDFIDASVRSLAADGCFLEIGKRDIWTPQQFSASRPAGRYFAIDLAAQRREEPAAAAALFQEVMRLTSEGAIRALDMHTFPLESAATAFRFMAQARHIGKIVLTQVDSETASLSSVTPHASYLITGGLSGLGLRAAAYLVERGVRHLILVARRAPLAEAEAVIAALRAQGAQVVVAQADISVPSQVQSLIGRALALSVPLRGIIHAAGLLEDGALMRQSWEVFERPLAAKIAGAWALHELTKAFRLDFFILYSSMASLIGSPGQTNYAAANGFLDALAGWRRATGLPALSINWGAWSETGMAAERSVDARGVAQGIRALTPEQGLAALDALSGCECASVGVFPVDWAKFLETTGRVRDSFFRRVQSLSTRGSAAPGHATSGPAAGRPAIAAAIAQASPGERAMLLTDFVADQVAQVTGAARAADIDRRQPLNELGLDSLMAIELRNRLGSSLDLAFTLPATLVFDYPTTEALAAYLTRALSGPEVDAQSAAPAADSATAASVDDLSDEDIERLYAKKMGLS